MSKKYAYSEIFYSIQGEGKFTGIPTLWLRYFLCNLQCDGFGQKNPKDPSSYILPYKEFDVNSIKRIEDLPVFTHGCDSSYSWSKKFKHLQYQDTPSEIYNKMVELVADVKNKPKHICFTGGEPLLKHAQECTMGIMKHAIQHEHYTDITFETNGTQSLTPDFKDFLKLLEYDGVYSTFSISPKLHSVSGEKDAVYPAIIQEYIENGSDAYVKFVCNGTEEAWDEIDHWVEKLRKLCWNLPIWIMPVGATIEGQKEGLFTDAEIASQTLKKGYNVSARVHVYLWGNTIGV